jgi:hypothetical protein
MRFAAPILLVFFSGCVSELTMVVQDPPGDDAGVATDAGEVVDAGSVRDAGSAADAGDTAPVVDAGNPSCAPCFVTGPGQFCGLTVDISPFQTGGAFGGFQSDVGTGASNPITITLSAPINWVSIVILDPDFNGNMMRAYDAQGTLVSEVDFPSDGTPGVLTQSSQGTGGGNIVRVELIPAPADYVAYDKLQVIPEGCAGPTLN